MAELAQFLVGPDATIRDVMTSMDQNTRGIALVTDEEQRLLGTITDGDIRRAILAGIDLSEKVGKLLARKAQTPYARPITAPEGTSRPHLVRLMRQHGVRLIPLVSEDGKVADFFTLDEEGLPVTAVIMAGGYGTRLRPLTEDTPKPMLPVGGRPLLEWIVEGLREAGAEHVFMTTHYKAEVIRKHFGDGRDFGIEIEYIHEGEPSGTLGPLRLLESWERPVLVINGDILTRVDFGRMLRYHEKSGAAMTVGVRDYRVQVPYGTVEMKGENILSVAEKPSHRFFVNAGIYLLAESLKEEVVGSSAADMTDLIRRMIEKGAHVVGFPVREYWIDIGQHEDYERAQKDFENGI
jgi:dTDP-glucose pyrophosphorylase